MQSPDWYRFLHSGIYCHWEVASGLAITKRSGAEAKPKALNLDTLSIYQKDRFKQLGSSLYSFVICFPFFQSVISSWALTTNLSLKSNDVSSDTRSDGHVVTPSDFVSKIKGTNLSRKPNDVSSDTSSDGHLETRRSSSKECSPDLTSTSSDFVSKEIKRKSVSNWFLLSPFTYSLFTLVSNLLVFIRGLKMKLCW